MSEEAGSSEISAGEDFGRSKKKKDESSYSEDDPSDESSGSPSPYPQESSSDPQPQQESASQIDQWVDLGYEPRRSERARKGTARFTAPSSLHKRKARVEALARLGGHTPETVKVLTPSNEVDSEESNEEEEESEDEESDQSPVRQRRVQRQRAPVFDDQPRRSVRNLGTETKYIESSYSFEEADVPVAEGESGRPSIEKVLEQRQNEDKIEYLIKWERKSYRHATWSTAEDLKDVRGVKKLENFISKWAYLQENKDSMDPEDVEAELVKVCLLRLNLKQDEMDRQIREDYTKVDKVIASRAAEKSSEEEKEENQEDKEESQEEEEFLVKWKSLGYDSSTWETRADLVKWAESSKIDEFLSHNFLLQEQTKVVAVKQRNPDDFEKITEQPEYLVGGQLRAYQMEGLNWLRLCYFRNVNGILADEMGLGKTIQTISFLSYLFYACERPGPYLIVVPLSTLSNWESEFKKWSPGKAYPFALQILGMYTVVYHGNAPAREMIRTHEMFQGRNQARFNVLLTTYEYVISDTALFKRFTWQYLIVDEAHRLKNSENKLYSALQEQKCYNTLLITGTPLQNNIKELWNLLHFLEPQKFRTLDKFQADYSDLKEEAQIERLHAELQPHLLRRLKKDVETLPPKVERILRVNLSPQQKKYYKWLLKKNFQKLSAHVSSDGSKHSFLNVIVELKKVCNHPYLMDGMEDEKTDLPAMIRASSKLALLDQLLSKLKQDGHRVLIFSQMVRMLNILQSYLRARHYKFQRLDGTMPYAERQRGIDHFNAENSEDFVYLISTRAGGLGINLTTADTVIIFDSDYNPQNDLQAEARAHRIGQTSQVNVYRLISSSTVEEEIMERAKQKMILDHLVIQTLDQRRSKHLFDTNDLQAILRFGAQNLFTADKEDEVPNLDEILARAEERELVDGPREDALMSQFKVVNFETNDNFWKSIIPETLENPMPEPKTPLKQYVPPPATPKRIQAAKASKPPTKPKSEKKAKPKAKSSKANPEAKSKKSSSKTEHSKKESSKGEKKAKKSKKSKERSKKSESKETKAKSAQVKSTRPSQEKPSAHSTHSAHREENEEQKRVLGSRRERCKHLLQPVKRELLSMKRMKEDDKMERQKKMEKTKECVLRFGDAIESLARKEAGGTLSEDLWGFASEFTAMEPEILKRLYSKLKQAMQSKEVEKKAEGKPQEPVKQEPRQPERGREGPKLERPKEERKPEERPKEERKEESAVKREAQDQRRDDPKERRDEKRASPRRSPPRRPRPQSPRRHSPPRRTSPRRHSPPRRSPPRRTSPSRTSPHRRSPRRSPHHASPRRPSPQRRRSISPRRSPTRNLPAKARMKRSFLESRPEQEAKRNKVESPPPPPHSSGPVVPSSGLPPAQPSSFPSSHLPQQAQPLPVFISNPAPPRRPHSANQHRYSRSPPRRPHSPPRDRRSPPRRHSPPR